MSLPSLDFPFVIFELHLCHLWMLSLLYLDVVVVIFGCCLCYIIFYLSLSLDSLNGCYHWMLYLGATWKNVTL